MPETKQIPLILTLAQDGASVYMHIPSQNKSVINSITKPKFADKPTYNLP